MSFVVMQGHDPKNGTFILDCDSSPGWATFNKGVSPCLTESRYAGHWLTDREGRMTTNDMLRLQGVDPTTVKFDDNNDVRRLIGRAMSLNVFERILTRALDSAQIRPMTKPDRWESGEAVRE